MKHRILFLAAATTLTFAACNNTFEQEGGSFTQDQLDSILQYRTDSTEEAQRLMHDSIMNAHADSLANLESKSPSSSTPTKKGTTKPAVTAPAGNQNTTDRQMEEQVTETNKVRTQAEIEADKKAARFGDEAAKARLQQDEADRKAARFGDEAAKERVQQQETDKKADRFNR